MWPFGEWPRSRRIARGQGGPLRCSFCGKSQNDVRKLVAGPKVDICDECVELCNDILAEELEAQQRPPEAESGADSRPRVAGVAVCRLCGLPAPMDFVVMIRDRGYLCFVCLDAIRAAPEANAGQ